jgi:vacuolar-type H+-ATPase subunit F/Vma7
MIFMGDDSLGDGFRLIGFEVLPNPSPAEIERMLRELTADRHNAFLIVDQRIMQSDVPALKQVLREGGRIVVIAVPPLADPGSLSSEIMGKLQSLFGTNLLT